LKNKLSSILHPNTTIQYIFHPNTTEFVKVIISLVTYLILNIVSTIYVFIYILKNRVKVDKSVLVLIVHLF